MAFKRPFLFQGFDYANGGFGFTASIFSDFTIGPVVIWEVLGEKIEAVDDAIKGAKIGTFC
jgi:hypothetical protein